MTKSTMRNFLAVTAIQVFVATTGLPTLVQAADSSVTIDNFTFVPQQVTVKTGTTITWTNQDDIPHAIASSAKIFKSKALDTGDKFSFTFTNAWHLRVFLLLAPAHDG